MLSVEFLKPEQFKKIPLDIFRGIQHLLRRPFEVSESHNGNLPDAFFCESLCGRLYEPVLPDRYSRRRIHEMSVRRRDGRRSRPVPLIDLLRTGEGYFNRESVNVRELEAELHRLEKIGKRARRKGMRHK